MNKKLVLYGTGQIGMKWLERLGSENIFALIDSDYHKVGQKVQGKEVISVDKLLAMEAETAIFISTALEYKKEIYRLLRAKHLDDQIVGYPILEKDIYLNWDSYVDTDTVFEGRNTLSIGGQLFGCTIGFASYISYNTVLKNVRVGRYTSIGPNVRVIAGQHPTRNFVSTHPMFYSIHPVNMKSYISKNLFDEFRITKNGYTVEIGNDVWIGDGVTIMEGVSIADGTIVAASANVIKDTEPYSIVGGNPARLIRYRFEKDDIVFLQKLKWWDKAETWIEEHAKYFNDIKKLRENY